VKIFAFFVLISILAFSQSEQLPPSASIYNLLKKTAARGLIEGYNDIFLPLSLTRIKNYLTVLDSNRSKLDPVEILEIERFKRWYQLDEQVDFSKFNLLIDRHIHLIHYSDSLVDIGINPSISLGMNAAEIKGEGFKPAGYISYGGALHVSFGETLFGYLTVSNGNAYGDRGVNSLYKPVNQSFTFMETGLNHFDAAQGGLFFESGMFSVSIARQPLTVGNGLINKAVLSGESQAFDYINFGIDHKYYNFRMIHGWLTTPSYRIFSDSVGGFIKNRDQKYIVLNRFGFFPIKNLNIGVTQAVIYANRGVELGYLNPFMFLESAQRSLSDIDNSFLSFDLSYIPSSGIQLTGSINFDDINFEFLNPDKISNISNRFSYQLGIFINPSWLKKADLSLEYYFVRPYTYSHYGYGENLAYVNNGVALGVDLKPNSDMFSIQFNYNYFSGFKSRILVNFIRHGENITNSAGQVIHNVGGSFFYSTNYKSSSDAPFLDGEFKYETRLQISFMFEISFALNCDLNYTFTHGNYNEKFPPHYLNFNLQFFPF
jgi:hypothetical protein